MKLHLPLNLRIALLSVCLPLITPCAEGRQYSPDTTITLVGSYVRDGYSSDDDKQQGFECKDGGALHVNGKLTMLLDRNVIFTSNRAGKSGGAVYATSWDNGFSYIQNLFFGNNKAEGSMNPCSDGRAEGVAGGGGIFGCNYITNCDSVVFSSNKATRGSGAGILSRAENLGLTDNDSIIFRNNHAAADGGAIALKPGEILGTFAARNCILSVKNNEYVGFSHNKAECGNGGAIDAIGVVCSGNIENGVLFQSNSAAVNGGAIYADYFTCVGNKGTGISFVGNSAEYGGAVYADLANHPAGAPTGELMYSVYMSGNDCIRFADNVATGEKGGAIYAKGGGFYNYNVYIVNNDKVDFEKNKGGAIYSGDDVILQGNEKVRFQGNGTAIEAETIYLSTAGKDSYIYFDDSISASGSVLFNSLPQKYHTSSDAEPLAQGSVIFSGENSQSYSKSSSTLASGILRIENGASFKIDAWFSHQGGKTIIGQPKESKTVLDVYSSYYFDNGGGGCLTFDLNYEGYYDSPLVEVGGNLNLVCGGLEVNGNGVNAYLSDIALLKIGGQIKYEDRTYTYGNGNWFCTTNNASYTLPLEEILSTSTSVEDKAALEWRDGTLHYTQSEFKGWTKKVAGLYEDKTWRDDTMNWYDASTAFAFCYVSIERDELCWAASAANMIQYWQDKYAPLYQGEDPRKRIGFKRDAGIILSHLLNGISDETKNGNANAALKWWFLDKANSGSVFQKKTEIDNWTALGFTSEHFVEESLNKPQDKDLSRSLLSAFKLSETGITLGLDYYDVDSEHASVDFGNPNERHVVTVWEATYKEINDNGNSVPAFEIKCTDSDADGSILTTMVIKFSPDYGAYVASDYSYGEKDPNKDCLKLISSVAYLKTPEGAEDMLNAYYDESIALEWTGKSSRLDKTISKLEIFNEHYLPHAGSGWKKRCEGGGKTIYANAFITAENEKNAKLVFGDDVNGEKVTSKDVSLSSSLNVSQVSVSGSDYRFGGNGTLHADLMIVTGSLDLHQKVKIQDGTPIIISGKMTLSNLAWNDSALTNCAVTLNGGSLWCGGVKLSQDPELGSVILGGIRYAVIETNTQMKYCTLSTTEKGGTLGCFVDLDGGVLDYANWVIADKTKLNENFFHYAIDIGNKSAGDAGDYNYDYKLINAQIVSNIDLIGELPLEMSGSSLVVNGNAASDDILTIGSSGGSPIKSNADIVIDKARGSTVLAEDVELLTMPLEKTILSGETSITAAALKVSEESTLMNDGQIIAPIAVKSDGMLGGSGQFGATTVYDGGRLMVGSSPGAPVYETLTLQSGSTLMFCLDGSTPATESQKGWGSGTHSVLHVTRADGLTVENGSTVQVGCSLEFLNAVPLGDVQTLSLVQLSNTGSDALVGALQGGTVFMLAKADDTFSDLSEVGAVVHHAEWQQGANNTLELSFIVSSMPENALIWSNAAADGKWDSTSANWRDEHNVDTTFADDSSVAFYDAATVEVENTITPGDMVVSTPEDVVWSGSGSIAGSGSLTKEGSGELRIELSNADYTGYVTVRGGALVAAADHALGHAWVDVHGAELDLMNKATNNVVSIYGESTLRGASSLNFLELNSDSHVHVDGGYQVSEDRVLVVSGNNSYTGSLTLAGGTVYFLNAGLTVNGYTTFETGTTTTIDLSDWEGETNGSITLACLGNTNGYTDGCLTLEGIDAECELKFDAATGVLTLVMAGDEPLPGPEPEPVFAPVLNQNQQVAYDTMKNIMGKGTPGGLLGELGKEVTATRDEAKLKELLDALSGAEYATLMSSQQDATRGHMRRLRGSMGSGHALAGTKTRAYIEAYTNRSEVDGDASGRGYEMTENGGQFALEYLRDEKVSVGLAVAAGRSKLQPEGSLTQKSTNTYLDAFLVHRKGGYTGKTSLGASVHRYDMARNVMGAAVSAEADGSSVNFMHESAYDVALDDSNSVQFFGAVESSMGKLDAFQEKGADTASLQVRSQDAWMTTLSVGARYHYSFAAVDAAPAATLSLQAGLEYKLGDIDSDVEMSFSGARSHAFRQYGTKRDRFGYNVGASLHVPVSSRAAVYASGDAVLRGDSSEVNANLGVQVAF